MQNHVKVYLEHFGYSGYEFMPCEVCGGPATEIHHIVPRSLIFGKERDAITNLIGLCRPDHERAHNDRDFNDSLQEIANSRK